MRILRRFFLLSLVAFSAVFSYPAADARALLLEFPIDSYSNNSFQDYTASGTIRTTYSGGLYTFSSASFPSSPASVITFTPNTVSTVIGSGTQVNYNESVCFFQTCGGVRVLTDYEVVQINNPYDFSIDGQVDANAMTAVGNPVPISADIHVRVEIDSRVVLTGAFNDLPDLMKNALLVPANAAANLIGDGAVDIESTITDFDPTEANAIIQELPGMREVTINWNDILIKYSDPTTTFSGTVTQQALLNVINFFGFDTLGWINQAMLDSVNNSLDCPFGTPNCIMVPGESLSFTHPFNNVPPAGAPSIPEPSAFAMLAIGLAGTFLLRRRKVVSA